MEEETVEAENETENQLRHDEEDEEKKRRSEAS